VDESGKNKKMVYTESCKHRYCDTCALYKANKDGAKIKESLIYLRDNYDLRFLHLTLNIRNVEGAILDNKELKDKINILEKKSKKIKELIDELKKSKNNNIKYDEYIADLKTQRKEINKEIKVLDKEYQNVSLIRRMEIGFENLMQYPEIKAISKGDKERDGYIRKIEIPYIDGEDTFYPHFHIILPINKAYRTSRDRLRSDEWLKLWQKAMNDTSINNIRVQYVKNDDNDLGSLAYYIAKGVYGTGRDPKRYLRVQGKIGFLSDQNAFDAHYIALNGRKLLTYGGILKKTTEAYKKRQEDRNKSRKKKEIEYTHRVSYVYDFENREYVVTEKRELSDFEKARDNEVKNTMIEIDKTDDKVIVDTAINAVKTIQISISCNPTSYYIYYKSNTKPLPKPNQIDYLSNRGPPVGAREPPKNHQIISL